MAAVLGAVECGASPAQEPVASEWRQEFGIYERSLVTTGRSMYFVLEPDFQLVFEGKDAKLVITVLNDTMDVGGILTRVVEEREWESGNLVEVSRNFFAMDKDTKDVFYFGEDVKEYKDGKISGQSGSWRANTDDAKAGQIISGAPKIGMKYYQEIAPGLAMDRAEVISLSEKVKTPAGTFDECLKTREGSALKPMEKEFKLYAPGIGLVQDGDMLLVKYGFREK